MPQITEIKASQNVAAMPRVSQYVAAMPRVANGRAIVYARVFLFMRARDYLPHQVEAPRACRMPPRDHAANFVRWPERPLRRLQESRRRSCRLKEFNLQHEQAIVTLVACDDTSDAIAALDQVADVVRGASADEAVRDEGANAIASATHFAIMQASLRNIEVVL